MRGEDLPGTANGDPRKIAVATTVRRRTIVGNECLLAACTWARPTAVENEQAAFPARGSAAYFAGGNPYPSLRKCSSSAMASAQLRDDMTSNDTQSVRLNRLSLA